LFLALFNKSLTYFILNNLSYAFKYFSKTTKLFWALSNSCLAEIYFCSSSNEASLANGSGSSTS
jgi:hypothetical protein